MLLSVSLSNWRSHESTTLEFNKGTNLLVGIMGSGKSSVLDAISFALFGSFPSLEKRKQSLSDIIRLNQNHASVSLEFLWNGSKYLVRRKLDRKKDTVATDAEIFQNFKLLEKGTTAVNKYLAQLLHVDYDLFTRAIYSEQNNIDYFLNLNPGKRKQEIDALLGIDKFEEARANCTSLVNRLKTERTSLETKFSAAALEEAQKKEKEAAEKLITLRKSEQEVLARAETAKKSLASAEAEFTSLRKLRDDYQKTEKEKIRLEAVVNAARKELEGKEFSEAQLADMNAKLAALEKGKATLLYDMGIADKEISKQNLALGGLESKAKALEKDKADLQSLRKKAELVLQGKPKEALVEEKEKLSKTIAEKEGEQHFARARITEIEGLSGKLKPGAAVCPLCGTELGGEKAEHIIAEKKTALTEAKAKLEKFLVEVAEGRKTLQAVQEKVQSIELLVSRIAELEKRIMDAGTPDAESAKIREALASISAKRSELSAKQEALVSDMRSLSLLLREKQELVRKGKELANSESLLSTAVKKLSEIKFDDALYESRQKEAESLRLEYQKAESQKTNIKSELRSADELQRLFERERKRLEDLRKEAASLLKLEEELVVYKNALLQTQLSLRNELVESINAAMDEIWAIFYPYRDYGKIRFSATEKDYLFELRGPDGNWKALESVASGGERACAALTLRVAMAMVLTPNLSWLILDEPTHNLDREGVELLSQTLQMKLPEVVEQTIVITHEEGLMGSEFASSYKLSRDKENLGSTKVEKI